MQVLFHCIGPLGQFSLLVAITICVCVCLCVCASFVLFNRPGVAGAVLQTAS